MDGKVGIYGGGRSFSFAGQWMVIRVIRWVSLVFNLAHKHGYICTYSINTCAIFESNVANGVSSRMCITGVDT